MKSKSDWLQRTSTLHRLRGITPCRSSMSCYLGRQMMLLFQPQIQMMSIMTMPPAILSLKCTSLADSASLQHQLPKMAGRDQKRRVLRCSREFLSRFRRFAALHSTSRQRAFFLSTLQPMDEDRCTWELVSTQSPGAALPRTLPPPVDPKTPCVTFSCGSKTTMRTTTKRRLG